METTTDKRRSLRRKLSIIRNSLITTLSVLVLVIGYKEGVALMSIAGIVIGLIGLIQVLMVWVDDGEFD